MSDTPSRVNTRASARLASRTGATPAPADNPVPSRKSRTPAPTSKGARRQRRAATEDLRGGNLPATQNGDSFAFGSMGPVSAGPQVNVEEGNIYYTDNTATPEMRETPAANDMLPPAIPSSHVRRTAEDMTRDLDRRYSFTYLNDSQSFSAPALLSSVLPSTPFINFNLMRRREPSPTPAPALDPDSTSPAQNGPASSPHDQASVSSQRIRHSSKQPTPRSGVRQTASSESPEHLPIVMETYNARRSGFGLPPISERGESTSPTSRRRFMDVYLDLISPYTKIIRGIGGIAFMLLTTILFSEMFPSLNIAGTVRNLVDSIAAQAEIARNATINGTMFDPSLFSRLQLVEDGMSELRIKFSDLADRIPDQVALNRDPDSGRLIIPDSFYSALLERIKHDDDVQMGQSPEWEAFLRANRQRIETLGSAAADSRINGLTESGVIVTRRTFTAALDEQSVKLLDRMNVTLANHAYHLRGSVVEAASAAASSVASDIASRRLSRNGVIMEDLRLLSFAQSIELQRQRNYMNFHTGATINPLLTSPTYIVRQPNLLAGFLVGTGLSRAATPNPPSTALSAWTDAGQCWCAAISEPQGHAQLGVLLARPVRPRSLVVEHIPSQGTWDVGAAPREVQVWARRIAPGKSGHLPPSPPEAQCTGPVPAHHGNWICIGTGVYDVHSHNPVQAIPLHAPRWPRDLVAQAPREAEGYMFNEVIVQARSNWGKDWTCFYRVRLLGESMEEVNAELNSIG